MTTPAQSKERLLKLAWLLDNLTTEFPKLKVRFNLDGWAEKATSCHTTACACGWAGLHPWFRRKGFRTDLKFGNVEYGVSAGFGAVGRFFDLGINERGYLFIAKSYPKGHRGRRDVARRIRKFVKEAA